MNFQIQMKVLYIRGSDSHVKSDLFHEYSSKMADVKLVMVTHIYVQDHGI